MRKHQRAPSCESGPSPARIGGRAERCSSPQTPNPIGVNAL